MLRYLSHKNTPNANHWVLAPQIWPPYTSLCIHYLQCVMFCWHWTSISNPNSHIHPHPQHSCPPGSGSGCKHTLILAYLKICTSHEPKVLKETNLRCHMSNMSNMSNMSIPFNFFQQLLCFTAIHAHVKSCQHGNPSLFGRRKVPVTFASHSLRKITSEWKKEWTIIPIVAMNVEKECNIISCGLKLTWNMHIYSHIHMYIWCCVCTSCI